MGALVWFIAGILLACLELAAGELTFLMLSVGALATAGVALADVPWWAELLVFTVVSLICLFGLKPALRKKLEVPTSPNLSTQALVGHTGILEEPGLVRVRGELWSARPWHEGEEFLPQDAVVVVALEGNYLLITKENA